VSRRDVAYLLYAAGSVVFLVVAALRGSELLLLGSALFLLGTLLLLGPDVRAAGRRLRDRRRHRPEAPCTVEEPTRGGAAR
jgi:uncharacterized membrane protein YhaH (DUF805 family)